MARVIAGALLGGAIGAALGVLPGLPAPAWQPLPGSDVGHALWHFQRDLLLRLGPVLGGGFGAVVGVLAASLPQQAPRPPLA
jgi:hypothetical protein